MEGFYELDAMTFSSWRIDSLKVDGCAADPNIMNLTYPYFSQVLNATGI